MPTLAVTVWFLVVSKVRKTPSGLVTAVCGEAGLAPCTVGCWVRGLRSGLAPAKTLVEGAVALGVAAFLWVTLFCVTCLALLGAEEDEPEPPQVPLAVNGWLNTMSKCRL